MSVPLSQMALFLALPLWRVLIRTPSNNSSTMGQTSSQEDHIVYLDQDNILLPTVPPPPYSVDDPSPVILQSRRPIAVLAVVETIEPTEGREAREDNGERRVDVLGNTDSRRTSITLKRGRKEWELSLKAVLSVVVFLLAIVGIAWLGSMAVTYTWPSKEIPAEDSTFEHTVKSIYESIVKASYPHLMTPTSTSAQLGVASVLSSTTSPSSAEAKVETTTKPPLPARTGLSKVVFSPDLLSKVREHIGEEPIYDCMQQQDFMEGGPDERNPENELLAKTGVLVFYNKPKDFWCIFDIS